MGLVSDVHAAATRYHDVAGDVAQAAHDLAAHVRALGERLSGRGPLGSSADPALARARACCALAAQRLLAAVEAANASGDAAQGYADRAFPR